MVGTGHRHTMLHLVVATVCATAAILINDRAGVAGDIGVAALVFVAVWAIVDEAVQRLQTALRRSARRHDSPPSDE